MKKNILFVTFNNCYGGGEIYLENIINAAYKRDSYNIFVYTPKIDTFINNIKEMTIETVVGLSRYNKFLSYKNLKNYIKASKEINKIIINNNIDVLFLNGKEALYLAPFVKNIKKVSVAHTLIDRPLIGLKIFLNIISILYVDKLIFVSNIMQRQFNKLTLNLFKKKTITIYNGVDFNKFVFTKKNVNNKFVISNISRLEKEKGQEILINTFYKLSKKYNNIELKLGGVGKYELDLKRLVSKLNLNDKIEFLGFINPVELLKKSDIFVFPPIWKEPFGLVIIEAMSAKVPVIASNTGGIPEIIENEKNGILFKVSDKNELADKIELLMLNDELRNKIALNGYHTVISKFSLKKNTLKTLNVLDNA